MIVERFDLKRAREEIGEVPPLEIATHAVQVCQCRWCTIARTHATYSLSTEDDPARIQLLAEALTVATLNALQRGQPAERVVYEAMATIRAATATERSET
jgi:hypothetical protein